MANPNPEIWGTPETWVNAPYMAGETGTPSEVLKISKAKCADFGGSYPTRLSSAITSGRIVLNQPLDKTICPCGQAPEVSAFGKIAVLNENKDFSLTPRIIERTSPCNWFFFDFHGVTAPDIEKFAVKHAYTESAYYGMKYDQFAPKAVNDTYNPNMRISPFVFWYTRSILLSIQVQCITSAPDWLYSAWYTLDEWKNNHSELNICGIRFFVRGVNTHNTSTFQLEYTNSQLSDRDCSGQIGILDEFPNIMNNGESTPTEFFCFSCPNNGGTDGRYAQIFSNTYRTTNANANLYILPCYDLFDGQTLKKVGNTSIGYTYYYDIPYSDENYEKIMKMTACFGCYFTPTNRYQFAYDMLDNDLYLPIVDANGITHGEYTHGSANATNLLYDMGSIRDTNYNPTTPPTPIDTNTYSVTTGFNTVGNVASTTKAYVVNAAALTGLSGEMWNIINNLVTTPDDMTNLDNLTLDAFLTNNPIDAIVSVKKFPLSSVPHAENLENILLGKYQTGAAGYALAMQQARYNFEGIPIFPKFGNCFLDYSPYTKMQLYVPFCGTIDIDAADFMGRTLSVEMVIDFITGAVTAYVLANQLVVTSLTGNCGIDIAITGTEQSTVSAALENAILQDKSARGSYALKGSVGSMLTNPIGNVIHPTTAIENRFTTKLQTMKANYDLQHVEMPLRQIGNASPLNSWALEFVCRLIIYYPDGECITFNATNEPSLITEKVESFGAVNGFATVETNTLSSFTGFTQVSDADLSGISATDTEKEMILSLLQSGVYL